MTRFAGVLPVPDTARLRSIVGSELPILIFVPIAYYIGAQVAFLIGTASDKIFAPFWPPNVVLFWAFAHMPRDRWWLVVAAAFPAHLAAELGVGMDAGQLLVAFAANCIVALLNAVSLCSLLNGPPWFDSVRKTTTYIAMSAGVNPAVAALVGALGRIVGGADWTDFWLFWSAWYLANAIAALTLSPVAFTWHRRQGAPSAPMTGLRMAEAVLYAVALVAVCLLAFQLSVSLAGRSFDPLFLSLPLPIIIWGALRFGERGGSGGVLVVTVVSIWDALNGPSPFVAGSPELNVAVLQLFLVGIAIPAMLLSAASSEVRHAAAIARSLVGSLLRAQDEERRRIARDVHDTTAQNLIAAGLLVDGLGAAPGVAAAKVASVRDLIGQSVGELQTLAYLLHPPLLDQRGLAAALPLFIKGFSERSRVTVSLEMIESFPRLPIEIELVVYRVVQEALFNVARHSGSETAEVKILHEAVGPAWKVNLTITDFGVGMLKTPRRSTGASRGAGIGLDSMRERVHQIGGVLQIQSVPGKTTISAVLPVRKGD